MTVARHEFKDSPEARTIDGRRPPCVIGYLRYPIRRIVNITFQPTCLWVRSTYQLPHSGKRVSNEADMCGDCKQRVEDGVLEPCEFAAAGFLWWRRRKRESGIPAEPLNLLQRIEVALSQSRTTIQRGRDMAIVFSAFIFYGVAVRIWIYGWPGSEIKAVVALVSIAILLVGMKTVEVITHGPRMKSLGTLRQKLLDVSQAPAEN